MTLGLGSKFSKNEDWWLINYLYTCMGQGFYLPLHSN
nr:MAG TPA: hypothetical protein [Crassvirales sp.]